MNLRSRWVAHALLLLLLLLLAVVGGLLGVVSVRNVGRWLAVSEPLERCPAVVVLGGDPPFRAMEAS